MSLAGKVALITGASRGIGQAIMLKLASSGAYVVGTATSETGKEAINKVLKENNLIGEGAVLDVANPSSVESLIKHLQATEKQALIL